MLHFKGICLFQSEQNELDACTYQGIKYILNVSTEIHMFQAFFKKTLFNLKYLKSLHGIYYISNQ